jgi:long-subunit acyl-CoA synthetase (AMP-forming)
VIQTKTWYYIKYGFIKNTLFDHLFLVIIRNILGGRMRIMFSGGAPLSP